MKKKILLLITGAFSLCTIYAQVGINTTSPYGIFHVDTKTDTGGSKATPSNDADDFIIDDDGNVGIGTAKPTTKLDIRTGGTSGSPIEGFKLVDGNQSAGKVLTSDVNGKATWASPGFSQYTAIKYEKVTFQLNDKYVDSGITIIFPSTGTYAVSIGLTLNSKVGFNPTSNTYTPAMQLVPKLDSSNWTDVADAWGRTSPRFLGSFEIFGINTILTPPTGKIMEFRFYYNQNITVDAQTGLTAYLIFVFNDFTKGDEITLILGNNPGTIRPQSSGGSFIRIN